MEFRFQPGELLQMRGGQRVQAFLAQLGQVQSHRPGVVPVRMAVEQTGGLPPAVPSSGTAGRAWSRLLGDVGPASRSSACGVSWAGVLDQPPGQHGGGKQHERAEPENRQPPAGAGCPAARRPGHQQHHAEVDSGHTQRPGCLEHPGQFAVAVGATAEDDGQQVREDAGQHLQGKANRDGRDEPVDPLVEIDDLCAAGT
jgi:hypothetical protein